MPFYNEDVTSIRGNSKYYISYLPDKHAGIGKVSILSVPVNYGSLGFPEELPLLGVSLSHDLLVCVPPTQ